MPHFTEIIVHLSNNMCKTESRKTTKYTSNIKTLFIQSIIHALAYTISHESKTTNWAVNGNFWVNKWLQSLQSIII